MADISTTGDPNLRALINSSGGTTGSFRVRDANTSQNILNVDTGGDVEVTARIYRAVALVLDNTNAGLESAMLTLRRSGTDRMEFEVLTGSSLVQIRAVTAGYAFHVRGYTVDIVSTESSGVISNFRTDATSRLTVEYNSSRAEIKSGTTLRIDSGAIEVNNSTASSTILSFRSSGTERLAVQYDSGAAAVKVVAPSTDEIWLTADFMRLNAIGSSTTIAQLMTSGTWRLAFDWDSGGSAIEMNGASTYAIKMISGGDIHLKFGVSATSTLSFVNGSGDTLTTVSETGVWTWKSTAPAIEATLEPDITNNDCTFTIGIADNTRGKIVIRRDEVGGGNNRAGVLMLEAEDGQPVYVNVGLSGGNYYLYLTKVDPGTNDVAGTQIPYAAV